MKFKMAFILGESAFDFTYYENSFDEQAKVKSLLLKDNVFIYQETKDQISFKFSTNKFFKEHKYIDIMNFIFKYEDELQKDDSVRPFIKNIKDHLQKLKDNDENIFNLFIKIIKDDKTKEIAYQDILKIVPYQFQLWQAWKCFTVKRIANFSSPGSGKTLTSMLAVLREYIDNNINNLVIIGPKSARDAWINETEIKDFYQNSYKIKCFDFSNYHSNKLQISDIKNNYQSGDTLNLIFINYHKLQTDTGWYENLIAIFEKKTGLIVDECHYFKNKYSQKFKKLKNFSIQAAYVYFLSGTPLPRAIKEGFYLTDGLWPLLDNNKKSIIDNKITFNMEPFNKDYFKKIYVRINKDNFIEPIIIEKIDITQNIVEEFIDNKLRNNPYFNALDVTFGQNINRAILIRRMQAASSPHSLKMTLKASINEIFEEEYQSNVGIEDVESGDAVLNINNLQQNEIEKKLEEIISSSEVQTVINNYQENEDPRFIKLWELLQKLDNERIIIWNVFRNSTSQIIKFIKEKYGLKRIVYKIDGSVLDYERKIVIAKIRKSKNGILVASPATIAESISLHREIDYAIYFFRNYVGSHWMQSIDRIHRLVAKNEKSHKKFVYLLISKNSFTKDVSIDKLIDTNLDEKMLKQKEILDN